MSQLLDLRAQLQKRKEKFDTVRYDDFVGEVTLLLDFLRANSYTAALMALIDANQTITFDQWWREAEAIGKLSMPSSEIGRAKICLGILMDCIEGESSHMHFHWGYRLGHDEGEDGTPAFLGTTVVEPIISYLQDRVNETGNVLYLLQRFKTRVEWFRREDLHAGYVTDTRHGEKRLDRALREFLFDGGIDFPLSQPESPAGQADIVASLGSDDPLVLEVKVFDPGRGRNKSHIRQGFHQVLKYANDYNESVGYLVVFNCSPGLLSFQPGDGKQSDIPPRVVHGGKTFFLIVIDIGVDRASASKESPASRADISLEELTGPAS